MTERRSGLQFLCDVQAPILAMEWREGGLVVLTADGLQIVIVPPLDEDIAHEP